MCFMFNNVFSVLTVQKTHTYKCYEIVLQWRVWTKLNMKLQIEYQTLAYPENKLIIEFKITNYFLHKSL